MFDYPFYRIQEVYDSLKLCAETEEGIFDPMILEHLDEILSLVYGADAWGNPLQYGSRAEAHDAFIFVSSGEARLSPYCISERTPGYVFRVSRITPGTYSSILSNLYEK